jgi:ankyrin repeat protein
MDIISNNTSKLVNTKGKGELIPLTLMVLLNKTEEALILINYGAYIERQGFFCGTTLIQAASNGNYPIVKLLIESRAGVNIKIAWVKKLF